MLSILFTLIMNIQTTSTLELVMVNVIMLRLAAIGMLCMIMPERVVTMRILMKLLDVG